MITPSAGASLPSIARCEKCGPRVDAELGEGALVDQQREPLARCQLVLLVLAGDLLLAAAEPGRPAPLLEILDERAERGPGYERVGCCAFRGRHK